jgi:hypothetical protein
MEFELKFKEAKGLLKYLGIYLKYSDVSEFDETWSRCFSLHLVSSKIVSKRFLV